MDRYKNREKIKKLEYEDDKRHDLYKKNANKAVDYNEKNSSKESKIPDNWLLNQKLEDNLNLKFISENSKNSSESSYTTEYKKDGNISEKRLTECKENNPNNIVPIKSSESLGQITKSEAEELISYNEKTIKIPINDFYADVYRESLRLYKNLFSKHTNTFRSTLMFYPTDSGIVMLVDGHRRLIYKKKVTQLHYSQTLKQLIFIENMQLKFANVQGNTEFILPIILEKKVRMFYYAESGNEHYIAAKSFYSAEASILYVYIATKISNKCAYKLICNIHIGMEIFNIFVHNKRLIVCAKELLVYDLERFIHSIYLDPGDLALNILSRDFVKIVNLALLRIGQNRFLVCNNKFSYIIDERGSLNETSLFFIYYEEPNEFRIFHDYFIVAAPLSVSVYDLKTAHLLKQINIENLKFVGGTLYPWLHDGKSIYHLNLPDIIDPAEVQFVEILS
ncbi:hypothetical protein EDEG_02587 [Edhazardia aedis USNM 41457]|uniref:CNH domain-containing protein n=1 Tax=Edhazardia aedis (strain USNM 41457) TaxID=1003232 RepID=J9DK70_EDHAE|nr:hypothetical protein EDEG_02587 [Edhazardia aedis USNM 41457]|eukprot:EJW03005.1 hypothetical protein EDEG_02587 [Edhazardia aedis USNM 41457]